VLTAASLPRFVRAMKLTGESARYFFLLVCRDRADLFDGASTHEIPRLLEKSRAALMRQIENRRQPITKVYSQSSWPLIYACLGSEKEGASIEEIAARSRIPVEACRKLVAMMQEADVVKHDMKRDRYISVSPHLIHQNLSKNSGFKDFFLASLRRVESDVRANLGREDRLFFTSVVTVKKSELHKFRTKLRELLENFVETAENPGGEDVVTTVCGFFPNS
jgi:hypothetical protein